jgi:hypothetical protein
MRTINTDRTACNDTRYLDIAMPVRERHARLVAARLHWIKTGFSPHSATMLAKARWSNVTATQAGALAYVLANTNLREQDLL